MAKKILKKAAMGIAQQTPKQETPSSLFDKGKKAYKNINVNVSGKMGNLDANKVRSNETTTGKNYTFTKVKPGSMSGSDSSYVSKFSKNTPILANKKKGGAVKSKKK
jgi:hypothetical protein